MATAFSQLGIGRAAEVLLSPSMLSSFSYYQNNSKIAFKSEELNFFNPELSEEYNIGDLIHLDKNTIYRNVYLFIERIRDIARIKIPTIVQIHLYIFTRNCLKLVYRPAERSRERRITIKFKLLDC
jgi:hypothetical protein